MHLLAGQTKFQHHKYIKNTLCCHVNKDNTQVLYALKILIMIKLFKEKIQKTSVQTTVRIKKTKY